MKSCTWGRIQDTRVKAIKAGYSEVLNAAIHEGMDVRDKKTLFRRVQMRSSYSYDW